jgi:hypothetical protein
VEIGSIRKENGKEGIECFKSFADQVYLGKPCENLALVLVCEQVHPL